MAGRGEASEMKRSVGGYHNEDAALRLGIRDKADLANR